MDRISSQDRRSPSCQEDLGWSEFQVKNEEVLVIKTTLDGQNFKSRLKKPQSLVRPWMLRSSNEDEEGEKSPKQPIAGLQLTGT